MHGTRPLARPLARPAAGALLLLLRCGVAAGEGSSSQADPWSVPLYLWSSSANNDTALLATPPAPGGMVVNPGSYSLVFAQPVAFASPAYAYGATDVELTAYWSKERRDIQTTNWDLVTLNQYGGDYVTLARVGYLQSRPMGTWASSGMQAPLFLSYSGERLDALTAPVNAADVDTLATFAAIGGGSYNVGSAPNSQHVVGYGLAGRCPVCNTALAAAYPSQGGADCPVVCPDTTGSFTVIYPVGTWAGAGPDQFRASMSNAGSLLSSGKFGSSVIKTESGGGLHVSFEYLCCYSPAAQAAVREVLRGIDWPPLNISFGAPVWRIDNPIVSQDPADTSHHFSIIVLLDEPSNARLEAWVATVEATLRSKGILVHLPRSKQQPFHSTLGVVNGLEFAMEAALEAINTAIPPHSWTTANLTLGVPDF